MEHRPFRRVALIAALTAVAFLAASSAPLTAQAPPPAAPARAAATPRDLAPLDFTGYWVSVVTEDWRYRMVMPQQGDYGSVPLNAEGKRVADSWKPPQVNGCEAFGVGAGMRAPGRLHITWADDATLKIEEDAGQQTRLLRLGGAEAAPYGRAAAPVDPPTWQGTSVASWDGPPDVIDVLRTGGFDNLNRGSGAAARRLAWTPLKVVTTNHKAGWLRANGVPYSAQAAITEHFMRYALPDGSEWLTVRTVVDDPLYLVQPFMVSTNFKREPDGSKWNPRPCRE
jgi:hypothetical protein